MWKGLLRQVQNLLFTLMEHWEGNPFGKKNNTFIEECLYIPKLHHKERSYMEFMASKNFDQFMEFLLESKV